MSMRIDGRVRWSCGSVDRHTAQRQPMNGTPWDVPLPRTVTRTARGSRLGARGSMSRVNDPRRLTARFDEAHPQLVENLLEDLALFAGEVAPRLLLEQREDIDHLRRTLEVRLRLVSGGRIGKVAEMDRGGARQRQHERGKRELRHLVIILANARVHAPC